MSLEGVRVGSGVIELRRPPEILLPRLNVVGHAPELAGAAGHLAQVDDGAPLSSCEQVPGPEWMT